MTPSPREDRCPPPRPPGRRRRAPGIGKSCIVLRTSTEAVEASYARVMGLDATAIYEEMLRRARRGRPSREHPYGTGDAAKKIVDALDGFLAK